MFRIAALLTCHNRKKKTLNSLKHLVKAHKIYENRIELSIYLTDDGSTDGTRDMIEEFFPQVIILNGNGSLYWTGGMYNSWSEALKKEYDGYLLLNDDTNVSINLFDEMQKTHDYALRNYKSEGIYIGSTRESKTKQLTYSGEVIIRKFPYKSKKLVPNGSIQPCNLGNANIMFVMKETVIKIGILSKSYVHAAADYDYTLTANKNSIPVLLMASYCGECSFDHNNKLKGINRMSFIGRIKFLYNPVGIALPDQLRYMIKFYPYRIPFTFFSAWFKVLFPNIFLKYSSLK